MPVNIQEKPELAHGDWNDYELVEPPVPASKEVADYAIRQAQREEFVDAVERGTHIDVQEMPHDEHIDVHEK